MKKIWKSKGSGRERKQDSNLGGVEGWEAMVEMYFMREQKKNRSHIYWT